MCSCAAGSRPSRSGGVPVVHFANAITSRELYGVSALEPLLAQFDNTIKNTLKNAILLSIGNLPYSLVMAALNLSAPLLLLFATSFFLRTCIFWILIGGSLVAMLNSYLLRKIFKKYFELD